MMILARSAARRRVWLRLAETLLSCMVLLLLNSSSFADELKTRYATIIYGKEETLMRFSARIAAGLSRRGKGFGSVCGELGNELDNDVERIEAVLHVFPGELQFRIVLLESADALRQIYRDRYRGDTDYIAFYAPEERTIFIAVDDVRPGVLLHELTHVILDHYFVITPPAVIQEILAQFVELHLGN